MFAGYEGKREQWKTGSWENLSGLILVSSVQGLCRGLELSVWGRNLTDDRYIGTIFDSVGQQFSISGYPNQPRTYGVSARFKF